MTVPFIWFVRYAVQSDPIAPNPRFFEFTAGVKVRPFRRMRPRDIHANLGSGNPCRNDDIEDFLPPGMPINVHGEEITATNPTGDTSNRIPTLNLKH